MKIDSLVTSSSNLRAELKGLPKNIKAIPSIVECKG